MELSIIVGDSKQMANQKLEELPNKLSASLSRPSLTVQKPPGSAKLPRKHQSYNSLIIFPFDHKYMSEYGKLRSCPSTLNLNVTRPVLIRHIRPLNNDVYRSI